MCHSDKLLVAAVNKESTPITYNILTLVLDPTNTSYIPEVNVPQGSTDGSNYGRLVSSSPSCAWVVTSHSAQTIKLFLKAVIEVKDSEHNYTIIYRYTWQFFQWNPMSISKI